MNTKLSENVKRGLCSVAKGRGKSTNVLEKTGDPLGSRLGEVKIQGCKEKGRTSIRPM